MIDPLCPKEELIQFETIFNEILKMTKTEEDGSSFVDSLMKIETRLLQLCEARNYLVMKDMKLKPSERENNWTIEEFEKTYIKSRKEALMKDNQVEKKRLAHLEAKMQRKKDRMDNLSLWTGRPDMPRSEKRELKSKVVKKDIMDDQTKIEKKYLGNELFQVLEHVKAEFPDDEL